MSTLILQSPGVILNPPPGSIDPPDLGISGLVTRHVPAADYMAGENVTVVGDLISGRAMTVSGGTAQMAVVGGLLAARIAGGAKLETNSYAYANGRNRSLALMMHIGSIPTATRQPAGTLYSGTGGLHASFSLVAVSSVNGYPAAYGDASPYPRLTSVMAPGWHRVIATFNQDGTGAVAVDGVVARGAQGFTGSASTIAASVRSFADMIVSFADMAVFDHALSDAEIAAVDAGMASWLA